MNEARLKEIKVETDRKWEENLKRFKQYKIKFVLFSEAPPWTSSRQPISYFYINFNGQWCSRIWNTFFKPAQITVDTRLNCLAKIGFLLIDTLPLAKKYNSRDRRSEGYKTEIQSYLPILMHKLSKAKLKYSSEVKVALAFYLNGLAIIKAFPKEIILPNDQKVKFSENQIAADKSGFTNPDKLRKIFGINKIFNCPALSEGRSMTK